LLTLFFASLLVVGTNQEEVSVYSENTFTEWYGVVQEGTLTLMDDNHGLVLQFANADSLVAFQRQLGWNNLRQVGSVALFNGESSIHSVSVDIEDAPDSGSSFHTAEGLDIGGDCENDLPEFERMNMDAIDSDRQQLAALETAANTCMVDQIDSVKMSTEDDGEEEEKDDNEGEEEIGIEGGKYPTLVDVHCDAEDKNKEKDEEKEEEEKEGMGVGVQGEVSTSVTAVTPLPEVTSPTLLRRLTCTSVLLYQTVGSFRQLLYRGPVHFVFDKFKHILFLSWPKDDHGKNDTSDKNARDRAKLDYECENHLTPLFFGYPVLQLHVSAWGIPLATGLLIFQLPLSIPSPHRLEFNRFLAAHVTLKAAPHSLWQNMQGSLAEFDPALPPGELLFFGGTHIPPQDPTELLLTPKWESTPNTPHTPSTPPSTSSSTPQTVVILSLHGWHPFVSTSPRNANKYGELAEQAVWDWWYQQHGHLQPDNLLVRTLPLASTGTIADRLQHALNKMKEVEVQEMLKSANAVVAVAHSQGSIVAIHLLAALFSLKILHTQVQQPVESEVEGEGEGKPFFNHNFRQTIGILSLSGVMQGTCEIMSQWSVRKATRELAELASWQSEISLLTMQYTRELLDYEVRFSLVAAYGDIVSPIDSSLMAWMDAPGIQRSLYVHPRFQREFAFACQTYPGATSNAPESHPSNSPPRNLWTQLMLYAIQLRNSGVVEQAGGDWLWYVSRRMSYRSNWVINVPVQQIQHSLKGKNGPAAFNYHHRAHSDVHSCVEVYRNGIHWLLQDFSVAGAPPLRGDCNPPTHVFLTPLPDKARWQHVPTMVHYQEALKDDLIRQAWQDIWALVRDAKIGKITGERRILAELKTIYRLQQQQQEQPQLQLPPQSSLIFSPDISAAVDATDVETEKVAVEEEEKEGEKEEKEKEKEEEEEKEEEKKVEIKVPSAMVSAPQST
jgi:hypothetical protein